MWGKTIEEYDMKIIGKGDEVADILMSEVEALFEMNKEQRDCIELAIERATDIEEPDWTYETLYEVAAMMKFKIAGQPIESENYTDEDGNPDGGFVEGPGLQIRWQRGPLEADAEGMPWNGCFLVTALEAAKRQLEYYQGTKFKCGDNEEALLHVENAIRVLNRRQVNRFCRGVRGGHEE